jgi:hypothetical protein
VVGVSPSIVPFLYSKCTATARSLVSRYRQSLVLSPFLTTLPAVELPRADPGVQKAGVTRLEIRPLGHTLHAPFFRSPLPPCAERASDACNVCFVAPSPRGAMARANPPPASGWPCTGHLPENGLVLTERLHELLGVAVLLLRLPTRLVHVHVHVFM